MVNGSDPNTGINRADSEVPASGTTSGTYTMHFTVVYDEISINDEGEEIFVQRFTREEQYTVVIQESFYIGLLSEDPTVLSDFVSDDNRGALSVGREFTITNSGSTDLDIYIAIPDDAYTTNFEITTMGYPIRLRTVTPGITNFTVLNAGTVTAGRNVTFEIARV